MPATTNYEVFTMPTIENKTAYFNLFIKPIQAVNKKMDATVRENPDAIADAVKAVSIAKAAKEAASEKKNEAFKIALAEYGFLSERENRTHLNALVKMAGFGLNTGVKIASELKAMPSTQCTSPIGFVKAYEKSLKAVETASDKKAASDEAASDETATIDAPKRTKADFMKWVIRQYETEFKANFFDDLESGKFDDAIIDLAAERKTALK